MMSRCSRSPSPHNDPTLPIDAPTKTGTSFPDDDMPIQSRGGYAIDFDNLDSVNPFQSTSNMILSPPKPSALLSAALPLTKPAPPSSSPAPEEEEKDTKKVDASLDETLPFIPSVENSLEDLSTDGASTDNTVIIETRKTPPADHCIDNAANVEAPKSAPIVNEEATDSLLLPKGSYQIDFENLDSVNPFLTGASKIQNSPPVSRKWPVCSSGPPEAEEKSSGLENSEMPSEQEDKLSPTEKPCLTKVNADTTASSVAPPKEAPMLLEFTVDDEAEVERKPPPKCLGLKRPPLSKTKPDATKPASALPETKSLKIKPKSCDTVTEIPSSRGAYSIDFDQFDDPNFNPFSTKAKMGSAPACGAPVVGPAQPENQESSVENQTHRSVRQYVCFKTTD